MNNVSKEKETGLTITDLPPEILEKIFTHLTDVSEFFRIELVNKTFGALAWHGNTSLTFSLSHASSRNDPDYFVFVSGRLKLLLNAEQPKNFQILQQIWQKSKNLSRLTFRWQKFGDHGNPELSADFLQRVWTLNLKMPRKICNLSIDRNFSHSSALPAIVSALKSPLGCLNFVLGDLFWCIESCKNLKILVVSGDFVCGGQPCFTSFLKNFPRLESLDLSNLIFVPCATGACSTFLQVLADNIGTKNSDFRLGLGFGFHWTNRFCLPTTIGSCPSVGQFSYRLSAGHLHPKISKILAEVFPNLSRMFLYIQDNNLLYVELLAVIGQFFHTYASEPMKVDLILSTEFKLCLVEQMERALVHLRRWYNVAGRVTISTEDLSPDGPCIAPWEKWSLAENAVFSFRKGNFQLTVRIGKF